MAANFLKAMGEANLSVTTSRNGSRFVGGNAAMDREDNEPRSGEYRGRNNRGRGRSRGGGRRYNNRRGGRYSGVTPYSRFEQPDNDGDESMGESSHSNFRYKPYGGRQNQSRNYSSRAGRNDSSSYRDSKWFKISIPGGKNHDKNWLISKMKNLIDEPYEIVQLHYVGDTACFFVDDKNVADKLKTKSHRITCKDGSKIVIHVRNSPPPRNTENRGGFASESQIVPSKPLDEETEKILMNCLAQRFLPDSNSVNLSKLVEDTTLSSNNIQGNLNKPWLMQGIIELINRVSPGKVPRLEFYEHKALTIRANAVSQTRIPILPRREVCVEKLNLLIDVFENIREHLVSSETCLTCNVLQHSADLRFLLIGLDMSGNRIRNLELLKCIPGKLPNLEVLSLKDNEIQTLEELEKLKIIKSLKHLHISGNPVYNKYQSSPESLLRDVRSKLDTLETLEGVQLPPPILFDVPSATPLPDIKEHYSSNPQMQQKIIQFVTQFFQLYDRDDRQGLLELYHDQATLSMCVNTNVHCKDYSREKPPPLNDYYSVSRNLKRLRDKGKRMSLIKNTKLAAVAFLSELPRTKHDLQSFALDVNTETATFVSFTVRGNFMEGDARDTFRAFSRTFILLISPDNRMKILNDQLHIRNSTGKSRKAAVIEAAPTSTNVLNPDTLSIEQEELIKKFSEASKMNAKYSLQCLKENNWDFQKAGEIFTNLQREGKIPKEAFLP